MVKFKSWRDTYLFILNYGKFSCLNCTHGGHNLDLNEEHSDFNYSHHFCKEWIAMVDFSFQFVCDRWADKDGNTLDGRKGECAFNLPSEVIEAIQDGNEWSYEAIRDLVKTYDTG